MEILRNANEVYVSMLGINVIDSTKSYRWNKLITSVEIDNGKVMFNGLTRAIIFLTNDELEIAMARKLEFLILPHLRRNINFFYAGANIPKKSEAYNQPIKESELSQTKLHNLCNLG
jgi:hypothetical protein